MKRSLFMAGSAVVLLLGAVMFGPAWAASAGSCPTLTVASIFLPPGTIGEPYTRKLPVFGGTPPVTVLISDGVLPPGLTLAADGTLTGTPKADGQYRMTVTATDACSPPQSAKQVARLVVAQKGADPQSQPSVISKKPLTVTVQAVPAVIALPAGETSVQVTYRLTAQPRASAVLESQGRSFLVNGAVIASELAPLDVTLVNGVGEIKETLTVPRVVLEAARREKGAKIIQSRPFIGHGTTALGVVEITLAEAANVGR